MQYFEKLIKVADTFVKENDPKSLNWSWGEALLLYSLSMLDDELGERKYFNFYKAYVDYHYEKGFVVDQSDTLAPVLICNELYKKTKDEKYNEMVQKGIFYLKNEPRLIEDLINHNGHSHDSKDYPKSIWVDSIMMSGVFTGLVSKERNDEELKEFAKTQPTQFAKYLQHKETKLFHHSYWKILNRPYPRNLYWGRGNGWVVMALSMYLDYVDDDNTRKILSEVSSALLKYQRDDYYFNTVVDRDDNYRESSATALIAGGWIHGVQKGYLDKKYLQPALKAYEAIMNNLKICENNAYMTEISLWTIPMFFMPYKLKVGPYPGYKYVKKGENITYGVASLIIAGIYYNQYKKGL